MVKRTIHLIACDDSTEIEIDLTAAELRTVERLMAAVDKVWKVTCQPRIEIQPLDKE